MSVDALQIAGAQREKVNAQAWWVYPAIPLFAAAIAFTWTLRSELQRMYGMTSDAWDLAYDQQVIWGITQGDWYYSSFARANFLGIHFEPIFVVIAAIEKYWPSPTVLLIFSSAGLAAAGPAAYLFFRAILPAERTESPWLAVALSAPIPVWAAIQEGARDFFHPENMALAFALLAAWAGIRGHRIAMWSFCVLTLACKEDQVYTVAVVGILMSAFGAPQVKKHWRFVLYLAAAWFLIGTGIVQQHFRNGGYTDFVYYRWLIGLDPTMPANLSTVLGATFRPGAPLVVAAIIAGMFALPLLPPRWLLLVIPPYLANVLSGHNPQNVLNLHYVMLLLLPLTVAGGVGARRFLELRTIRPQFALVAILPALILGWGTGRFPPALGGDPGLYDRRDIVVELQTATAMIPANAPVSADDGLAVWLANRHTINDFPDRLDGSCYVVLAYQAYLSGPTHPPQRLAAIAALPAS